MIACLVVDNPAQSRELILRDKCQVAGSWKDSDPTWDLNGFKERLITRLATRNKVPKRNLSLLHLDRNADVAIMISRGKSCVDFKMDCIELIKMIQ